MLRRAAQLYVRRHVDLNARLEAVTDRDSFLAFVRALVADRQTGQGWESDSIEQFLDAAAAWAEDSQFGDSQGLKEASPWKRFAVFLYCGKVYE